MTWYQFSNLPHIACLPYNKQLIEYQIYNEQLMTEQLMLEQLNAQNEYTLANAVGGGGIIQQEQSDLPSGCIEFVNNTSDGTQCRFWIETSAPTNYTITWGDGETTTGITAAGVGGGVGIGDGEDKLEIEHGYADSDTQYTARICFDDISLVTYLEFNGDD
jgi:hypothetical protein